MTPRVVTEPITGLGWIAHDRWSAALRWLPTVVALAAFGLGFFVGRAWW